MHCTNTLIMLAVILACGIFLAGCTGTRDAAAAGSSESVFVYCGAGLKAPMQEIGSVFEEHYGVAVEYTYAGSGALITQMELSRKGDAFIPGGTPDYAIALNKGLVSDQPQYVAYHVPVIAVAKDNPKNITCVEDFTKPGITVALGGINQTAIGKAGDKLF
ncbi:MAG TPA: extracellular solute-binding protein, partial [Methanoculleus sp.]|nr:extracellular solute-binding protein [Methanoculleus sp.]